MMVDDLVAGAQHHRKRLAGGCRPAGGAGLEGVREVGVRQELAGDRLGIDRVALAPARPAAPPIRRARGAHVPHVGARVHEGQGEPPAQEVAAFDRPDGLGCELGRPRLERPGARSGRAPGLLAEPAALRVEGDGAEDVLVGIDADDGLHGSCSLLGGDDHGAAGISGSRLKPTLLSSHAVRVGTGGAGSSSRRRVPSHRSRARPRPHLPPNTSGDGSITHPDRSVIRSRRSSVRPAGRRAARARAGGCAGDRPTPLLRNPWCA